MTILYLLLDKEAFLVFLFAVFEGSDLKAQKNSYPIKKIAVLCLFLRHLSAGQFAAAPQKMTKAFAAPTYFRLWGRFQNHSA
jgi:hypothetical protein